MNPDDFPVPTLTVGSVPEFWHGGNGGPLRNEILLRVQMFRGVATYKVVGYDVDANGKVTAMRGELESFEVVTEDNRMMVTGQKR